MILFFILISFFTGLIPDYPFSEEKSDWVVQKYPWYSTVHHNQNEDGFHNIWGEETHPGFWKIFKWGASNVLFNSEEYKLPDVVKIDSADLAKQTDSIEVYWIGHATSVIKIRNQTIITDPIFSERASVVSFAGPKRLVDFPVTIDQIPKINAVIISHSHYDHCDKNSLQQLDDKFHPVFIVPLKMKNLLNEWGITNVVELDWWQYVDLNGIRYNCTPARHRSNRGLTDINEILWSSWMMIDLTSNKKIYFGGDTAYSPHFGEISDRLGNPDIALLPIGAYIPRWLMQYVHVTPQESIQAFLDLKATHFIGIHWGTFDLAEEPLDEPSRVIPQLASEKGIELNRIHVLKIGGKFSF